MKPVMRNEITHTQKFEGYPAGDVLDRTVYWQAGDCFMLDSK